jgi:PAS domain S-box-containing protein
MGPQKNDTRTKRLLEVIEGLEARLAECEETLRAIREGEVDAVVVSGTRGDQVFTLSGSESVYRLIFETMHEAALTVSFDGRIQFCNRQFSNFVGTPQEKIIGRHIADFVQPELRGGLGSLLERSRANAVMQRLVFCCAGTMPVPAHISATLLRQPEGDSICIVATDLTELETSADLLRRLRLQQEALQEREELLRRIFDQSLMGIAVISRDNRISRSNAEFQRMLGYSETELQTMVLTAFYPEEDLAADFVQIRSLTSGETDLYVSDKQFFRRDGSSVWLHVIVQPIKNEEEQVITFLVLLADITERKQAEETLTQSLKEKEILMREIHHRVKNNLNILSSLLHLESDKLPDDASRQVFINAQTRIQSMKAIYDQLNRSTEIESVNLSKYVRDLSDMLAKTYIADRRNIRLTTNLASVQLDVKRAISLGIILNELITNAIKHAFPAGGAGNIDIELADSGGLIDLIIADNGVGLPEGFNIETADSLGWKLVSMLSDQLQARLSIINENGTKIEVIFSA